MWDSAKKPIKVRSVLQRNGMRHFIVNEETDEFYTNLLHQKRNVKTSGVPSYTDGNDIVARHQRFKNNGINYSFDNNTQVVSKERRNSLTLLRPLTNESTEDRKVAAECDGEFFGIAGSKICNSKKLKSQHSSRYFHQYPHSLTENSLLQLHKDMEMSKCHYGKSDLLNLVPVKSPVIKKLISGRASSPTIQQNPKAISQDGTPSTTLCSRIMTWIDLEVKRNSGKGKSSSALSFTSADLNIVNGLTLPCDLNPSQASISSASSTSDNGASSEESNASSVVSSSSSYGNSSTVSLPKLVPCWRKGVMDEGTSRVKKSVRISDDLPRWGKMKRRLRRKDRSMSLNELYDDELTSSLTSDQNPFAEGFKSKARKSHASTQELCGTGRLAAEGLWNDGENCCEDIEEKETDSFVVCDQRLHASGKVQVHIFLPQTDPARECEAPCSDNVRSDDSTS